MCKRRHFDLVAESYDSTIPVHVSEYYLSKRLRFIAEQIPRPARVLDVGCGTGSLDGLLSVKGFEVVGVDSSIEMLRIAKGRDLLATQGSADCLPFGDEAFDASISVAVFHHLAEVGLVKRTILEMVRVTKSRGAIIIWDHNPLNLYWPVIMRKVPQDTGSERLVSMRELLAGVMSDEIARVDTYRLGFVPDFVPEGLLPFFRVTEKVLERNPLTRMLAAHNVVVARKA